VGCSRPAHRQDAELKGLVHSLTDRIDDRSDPWYLRPVVLGASVLAATIALNFVFA
jgi:solute:Na+ symporter, SSS family